MRVDRGAAPAVTMIPDLGKSNPYLRLLSSALEARGARVRLARRRSRGSFRFSIREDGRPDLFHIHWQHPFFVPRRGGLRAFVGTVDFFREVLWLRRSGVRFVWTVHNLVNHEERNPRYERWASRLLARVVDEIVVHCDAAVPLVAREYGIDPARITVVPHGHYRDWYPEPPDRAEARRRLELPPDARIFLFFGMIRPYKNVDRLLAEFHGLGGDDLRLAVVGEPKTRKLRRELASQASADRRVVTRFEYVDDDELIAYLSACDAVVLPYRDSLTSGSAILAASCARACVMPALGCMADFPPDAAILYDPEDRKGLRDALERARDARLDRIGDAAYAYVCEFPWSRTADSLVELYAGLLGDGAPEGSDLQPVESR